jgi:hypothetical protein
MRDVASGSALTGSYALEVGSSRFLPHGCGVLNLKLPIRTTSRAPFKRSL